MPRTASLPGTHAAAASAARAALRLLVPGEVLSIQARFANTYLYAGSRGLVAAIAPGASRSVCAIGVDRPTFSALGDADQLLVGERTLIGERVSLRIARSWRTRVNASTMPTPETLAEFAAAVAASDRGLPLGTALDPRALIGLGAGLTPSGDDVICGAFAAAHAYGDPSYVGRLWDETRCMLPGTTALSAQFVRSAADGDVTVELLDLLHGLSRGEWRTSYDRLLRVGHTSGADLAHGVLLFLLHHRDHHHEGEAHR